MRGYNTGDRTQRMQSRIYLQHLKYGHIGFGFSIRLAKA